MKNNKITIFIFLVLIFNFILCLNYDVSKAGGVYNGEYTCDFNEFVYPSNAFDMYYQGIKWLNVSSNYPNNNYVYGVTGQYYSYPSNYRVTFDGTTFFNLTNIYCNNISFDYKGRIGNLNNILSFYSSTGGFIGKLVIVDSGNPANCYSSVYVYNNNNVSIAQFGLVDGYTGTFNNYFNISVYYNLNIITGNVNITIIDKGTYGTSWKTNMTEYTLTNKEGFGQIRYVCVNQYITSTDNIVFRSSSFSTSYLISYSSFGSVNHANDFTGPIFPITQSNVIYETEYSIGINRNIKQIALAISPDSELNKLSVSLTLNSINLGNYTNAYPISSSIYILVWESLNYDVSGKVVLEFNFVRFQDYLLGVLFDNSDIDGDGDVQYKWSYSVSDVNGVYDATNTVNNDLLYQVWYDSGGVDIDYINYSCVNSKIGYITINHPYIDAYTHPLRYTGNMTNFKILYLNNQRTNYNSLSYYALYLNGVYIGSPTSWEYYDSETSYLVWSSFNLFLNNQVLIIELYCNQNKHTIIYGEGLYGNMHTHDTQEDFGNNYVNGDFSNKGMVFCLGFSENIYENYSFSITSKYDIYNPILWNNFLDFKININNGTGIYYWVVNTTGSVTYEGGFNLKSKYYDLSNIWIDEIDGSGIYTFYITTYNNFRTFGTSSINTSYRFAVASGVEKLHNIKLSSTYVFVDEEFYFEYKAPLGEIIYIVAQEHNNFFIHAYNSSLMTGTGQYVKVYLSFHNVSGYHFLMINYSTNLAYPHIYADMHVYKPESDYTLSVTPKEIALGETVRISGTVQIKGGDLELRVFANGLLEQIIPISNYQSFGLDYQSKTIGNYYVLIYNGNYPHDNFKVYWDVTEHKKGWDLFGELTGEQCAILGLIVTILITLSPLLLIKSLKFNAEIPILVYAFTCSLGIVLCVTIGLFPFWVIPFIIIVGILIISMKYLLNIGGND